MNLLEKLIPSPGDVLEDRYVLKEELGRGGFGMVFRANHTGLDEDVAVKILLPHIVANPDLFDRFAREVFVAKGLRHHNTVRVLDYAQTESGLPFYVMEFLRGRSLAQELKASGTLGPARTQRVAVQILKSLAEAHAGGVVHRDLKPANVMLCEVFGEQDFVKVLDFGIAKALGTSGGAVPMTQTGMVIGTPEYMSPEQALADREIDTRSDIYSVGLIVAECLMGRPVVTGPTPFAVLSVHGSAAPLPFPEALEQTALWPIIERATRKDRDQRFPDAVAMRIALEELKDLPEIGPTDLMLGHKQTPPPMQTQEEMAFNTNPDASPGLDSGTIRESGPVPAGQVALTPPPGAGVQTPISGPQLEVGSADAEAETIAASAPERSNRTSKMLVLLAVVLVLVVATLLLIFLDRDGRDGAPTVATSGTSTEQEAPPVDDGLAAEETPTSAMDEEHSGETEQATPDDTDSMDSPTGDDQLAALEAPSTGPDAPTQLALQESLGVARETILGALPALQTVRFQGTDGMTVKIGDLVLGVTPFEILSPVLDTDLELSFERRGHTASAEMIRLDQAVVEVRLRRRSSVRDTAHRDDPTETESTTEEPGNLPFGSIQIRDDQE